MSEPPVGHCWQLNHNWVTILFSTWLAAGIHCRALVIELWCVSGSPEELIKNAHDCVSCSRTGTGPLYFYKVLTSTKDWESLLFIVYSLSHVRFLWPHGNKRILCLLDFLDKNTGVGCHFLLQGLFPAQGWSPCLLHWQVDSSPLSHVGSPNPCYGFSQIFWAIIVCRAPMKKFWKLDLPRWCSGKEFACRRHKRCRFNPWVSISLKKKKKIIKENQKCICKNKWKQFKYQSNEKVAFVFVLRQTKL